MCSLCRCKGLRSVITFQVAPYTFIAIYFKMASSQESNRPVDLFRVLELPAVCDLLFAFVNSNDLRCLHSLTVVSLQSAALLNHRTWLVHDEEGNPAFSVTYI